MDLHHFDDEANELAERIAKYSIERLKEDPPTLDTPVSAEELLPKLEGVINEDGLGPQKAFDVFENIVAPATLSTDHPRYLAFVPNAPANAASLIDLVVSASSMFGGTWLEGAGVVAAENQALRFISDMIGFPKTSGGVFVSGGTAANLSGLIAARYRFRKAKPQYKKKRLAILATPSVHSSIRLAAKAMDIDVIKVKGDENFRLTGEELQKTIKNLDPEELDRVFAVVASAGATNTGYVDDLDMTSEICKDHDFWFHVDGAYGGAAILCDKTRHLFKGVENADSFVIDPHKWLFSPFDCAALIYKDPKVARKAHAQDAEYLDAIHETPDWNPSDYAHHLTRRARGLTLWFTLAVHGTNAIKQAVTQCIDVSRQAAELIQNDERLELVIEPELSVILFKVKGFDTKDYKNWCESLMQKEFAFIVPTTHKGETVIRFCIINPTTTLQDITLILSTLPEAPED